MSGWDSDYRYEPSPLFQERFRCIPIDNYKNPSLETGNKIIMPQSSLARLQTLPVQYPLMFKIESCHSDKFSHCGVLEFCADEGYVYMPQWMMKNLNVEKGDDVVLNDTKLSTGVYMKLQPHTTAFVELPNPKAVLEMSLMRGFPCLSKGDTIMIRNGEIDFYLDVVEVNPGEAISLIDTDCILEFLPPLDYKEEVHKKVDSAVGGGGGGSGEGRELEEVKVFTPFTGAARRIDGTVVKVVSSGFPSAVVKREKVLEKKETPAPVPVKEKKESNKFQPFTGRARVTGGSFFSSN